MLNSSEKLQCPVRKNSLLKNYSFIRTQTFFFFQRLWQLQSADVVEKNTPSRRYIPLRQDHIFYSNNPMSIKGTRERKTERTRDGYNLIQGRSQGHTSITQRNMQGPLLIIILNVDRGSFYIHQLAFGD